jgi:hypothetical protein
MTTNWQPYIPNNFGVDIDYGFLNVKEKNHDEKCVTNPLFVNINGGNAKENMFDVYKFYDKVFIICMKRNFDVSKCTHIYDEIISNEEFKGICNNLVIIQAPTKILYNNMYKYIAKTVTKNMLEKMFGDVFKFNEQEVIIPLIELTENTVNKIMTLTNGDYVISDLRDFISLVNYYNRLNKKIVSEKLTNIIYNLRESKFWCDKRHCPLNINSGFTERQFPIRPDYSVKVPYLYGINKRRTEESNHIINEIETPHKDHYDFVDDCQDNKVDVEAEPIVKTINADKVNTYEFVEGNESSNVIVKVREQNAPEKKFFQINHTYIDVGTDLKKLPYFANTDMGLLKIKMEEVNELFSGLTSVKEQYDLFNALITAKDYCHMVLNNKFILEKMQPHFKKFAPLYKYLFGYGWLCMYIEECIFKTKTTIKHRYVFDIDTASKLPIFPFSEKDIYQNPYLTCLINRNLSNPVNNMLGVSQIQKHEYGICNFDTFKKRLNIFMTGKSDKDIFVGVDWSKFALSGSMIPACIQKNPPLLKLSDQSKSIDEQYVEYFNKFYGSSDIDIMYIGDNNSFFKDIDAFIQTVKRNSNFVETSKMEIEPDKRLTISFTRKFFELREKDIIDTTKTDWTVDDIISHIGSPEIKEYIYKFYVDHKYKMNIQVRNDNKEKSEFLTSFLRYSNQDDINIIFSNTPLFFDENQPPSASDYIYRYNDLSNTKVDADKNEIVVKICDSVKFDITLSNLLRPMQLFKIKGTDFFTTVARFHFPCVRGFYNNNKVYLLPSCITANMTGINLGYKYLTGIRDPIELVNKYRMRGFGFILNENEKKYIIEYNKRVENELIKIKDDSEIETYFGARKLNDKIYCGNDETLKDRVKDVQYMIDFKLDNKFSTIGCYYNPRQLGLNMDAFVSINNEGDVEPYQDWIPKAYYSCYKRELNKYIKTIKQ